MMPNLIWYICWFISAIAIPVTVTLTVQEIKKKAFRIKPLYLLMGGVAISTFAISFPVNLGVLWVSEGMTFWKGVSAVFEAIFLSFQSIIHFFGAGADIKSYINVTGEWIDGAYTFLCAALIIFAPALTFSFLLSMFKDAMARIISFIRSSEEAYVFSEMNENSVSLAESVRKENRKSLIIFAGVSRDEDKLDEDLIGRARSIGSVFYKRPVSSAKFTLRKKTKKIFFFAICNDEEKSISETLQLVAKYKDKENVMIYLFSHSIESELMLNNIDKGKAIVRRINPVRSLVDHILLNEGTDLFDVPQDLISGEKEISVVMVGLGTVGRELLKSLVWYCQMDGYKLRINAFDKAKDIEDQIKALCPELLDKEHNGVYVEGEAYYEINVHSCNVNSDVFRKKIREIGHVTQVYVSLGNDSENVTAAVSLRVLFEQLRQKPNIAAVVSNAEKREALDGAVHIDRKIKTPYNIKFIGDAKTVFSSEVIINSQLEKAALEVHKSYNNGDPDGFFESEYNYKSSTSAVIHDVARKYCKISGIGKPESELTEQEKEKIESIEHKRWNAYMRADGFIYSGSKEKTSRNIMGKMHNNLVDFSLLTPEEKKIDIRIAIPK